MCDHTGARNLYDQRPPSEGRELRPTMRLCADCGEIRIHSARLAEIRKLSCTDCDDRADFATWRAETLVGLCDTHARAEPADVTLYVIDLTPGTDADGTIIDRRDITEAEI